MIAKPITYPELKKAIKISFDNDQSIIALYDPNVPVKSIEDVQRNIFEKLNSVEGLELKGVFEKGQLIGYYTRKGGLLISFALACAYRTRSFLRKFFALIKSDFQGCFMCYLWNKNTRGIKWLIKNGMTMIDQDNQITQLILQ